MTDDYKEFRTHYIKGNGVYYALFISGMLSIFCLFLIFLIMDIWMTFILIWPTLILPFVILNFKHQKVRIGADYVERVTLFKKKRIYIKDVNKFGVFIVGSYTWPKVTSQSKVNDIDDDDLFMLNIYLTTNTEFDLDSFRPMKHLYFRYRKEIYFIIKDMMEKKDALYTKYTL